MQVSKQFLLEAVGLTLTVAVIFTGVRIYNRASQIIQIIEQRQEQQLQYLEEYEIIRYDGNCIIGSTAISYIKEMVGRYGLPITVTTGAGKFEITDSSQYAALRNLESEYYINPLGQFRCRVERDENEGIQGILLDYVEEFYYG